MGKVLDKRRAAKAKLEAARKKARATADRKKREKESATTDQLGRKVVRKRTKG